MLAAIVALAPLIIQLIKLFAGDKGSEAEKAKAIEEAKQALRDSIARTRAAIDKATETEGDTSDLEDIINKRPRV